MKLRIYKRHLLFSIAYFVTLMVLLLYQIGELPFPEQLRKVKYPYVFLVFILVLINGRIKKGTKAAMMVFFLYFAHTIFFGFVLKSDIVEYYVSDNASQMFWFLLFVLATFLYVAQNNFFKGFINLSFFACGLQLLIGMVCNRDNIVNPLWALVHAFTADVRFKNSFGFVHPGYTCNATYLVLALSLFFFELHRHTDAFKKLWFWAAFLGFDFIAGMELAASAERSGILSAVIVIGIYFVFVLLRIRVERKTLLVGVLVALLLVVVLAELGVWADIWGKSNRELNISINYPLFLTYGSPWTGLGFVENAIFQASNNAFPMQTSSLDMYYVYIFFSTGIIGCIMIGMALLIILVKLLINKKTDLNILAMGFYASMLFFAFWQCDLFTHRFISSYVISTIFLCTMSNDCCLGDDECINTESMG